MVETANRNDPRHVRALEHDLETEVFKDTLSVDKLLGHKTGGGKHGKTSVLKLLSLHGFELNRVVGLQAEGARGERKNKGRETEFVSYLDWHRLDRLLGY